LRGRHPVPTLPPMMNPDTRDWPTSHDRTLGAILRNAAAAYPDRTYVVFPDGSWTYAQFDALVDRVAAGLRARGLGKGSKLAIMLPNCVEFLALWFACARIGAVEVPVNTSFRGPLLKHVLHHSDAQALVVAAHLVEHVEAIADGVPGLQTVAVWGGEVVTGARHIAYADLVVEPGDAPAEDVSADDPVAIIFTSGTTGPSKGALLSHNYFWWFAERSWALRGEMRASERLYTCLPLFHANAQVLNAVTAMLRGQTAVIDTHFTASGFWQRLRDFGATQFNYIGGMIPILMKQPPTGRDREHEVRVALGAAAPKELWPAFEERFGIRVLECYGQTEDCVVTCNTLDAARVGSIGRAAWGYEMQVVDDDDRPVADGTVGEFVVRPTVPGVLMLGYYKMPMETLQVFRNLWFHTGDFGSRDADGYFWFKDRKKDAIRRRGENISAYEVEMVVNEHPAVLESAVYAVPSDVGEDDVMVSLVLQPGEALAPADLLRHCEPRLAYFAMPRYVDIRAELPKTPTHRVEKYRLRQQGITPGTWDRERAGYQLSRK
jgi:crotonobetaine/carnitine-CoA ligase